MGNVKKMNRSQFLKRGALLTGGLTPIAFGGAFLSEKVFAEGRGKGSMSTWPWPYPASGLNADDARIRAHDAYWSGKGCSFATFEAIIAGLRDTIGEPYNSLPTEMMIYGHGGGVEWGSTCGTINGCAPAICLVCSKSVSDLLIDELFGWYTLTQFPSETANTIAINNGYTKNTFNKELGNSVSNSILCHTSVTSWCKANETAVNTNDRKERCARMCGDVAYKAVGLLNSYFVTSSFASTYTVPAGNSICLSCHGSTGTLPYAAGIMQCTSCHGSDVYPSHVKTGINDNRMTDFMVSQNYPNPFSESTTLQFTLIEPEKVTIEIYSLSGRKVATLASNKSYAPGDYTLDWDGSDNTGVKVGSGMYIFNFITQHSRKTVSMIKR